MFCVFYLTNTGFVQCYSLGSRGLLHAFVVSNSCFVLFASSSSGLCSAFPFGSRGLLHAFVVSNSCFVLFASSSSGLCSAFPFGSPRVYTLLFFFVLWSLLLLCVLCPSSFGLCSDFFPGSFEMKWMLSKFTFKVLWSLEHSRPNFGLENDRPYSLSIRPS